VCWSPSVRRWSPGSCACGACEWRCDLSLALPLTGSGIVAAGSVSERPKERASKAREGSRPPWVQIPPLPPSTRPNAAASPWSWRRSVAWVSVASVSMHGDTILRRLWGVVIAVTPRGTSRVRFRCCRIRLYIEIKARLRRRAHWATELTGRPTRTTTLRAALRVSTAAENWIWIWPTFRDRVGPVRRVVAGFLIIYL
jgi:hypothetical protein